MVVWAADVPSSAVKFEINRLSGQLTWTVSELGTRNTLAVEGQSVVRLLPNGNVSTWTLTRFTGYSNNQVPGFGWEPNFFAVQLAGFGYLSVEPQQPQPLSLVVSQSPVYQFTALYIEGQRDSLFQVCVNVRAVPQQLWLSTDQSNLSGDAVLVSDRRQAAVLRLSGFLSSQRTCQLSLVASSASLSADQSSNVLTFGSSTGTAGSTPLALELPTVADFEFQSPAPWTVIAATQRFVVRPDPLGTRLLLFPANDPGLAPQLFEFVLDTGPRLQLGFVNSLDSRVNIISPVSFPSQLVAAQPSVFEVVGLRRDPGCTRLSLFPQLNWSPELVPFYSATVSRLFDDCLLRWVSGNASDLPGNVFYIRSTGEDEYQNRPELSRLRPYPMQNQSLCFVDVLTGQVPGFCGALQLRPFESNLGVFATGKFLDFAPQCMSWALAPTTTVNDEGYVTVFMSDANSGLEICQMPRARIPSFELASFYGLNSWVVAIVVPENLLLQLSVSSPGITLRLGPGTYSMQTLTLIEPRWPAMVPISFEAYCSTVNPRSVFISRMCSGFAGARSLVYRPQSNECDMWMRQKCSTEQLFNSAVCGCYQDQARLAAQGLPDYIQGPMVNRPQCFGSVCALGSAYREREWLEPCGAICQQVIVGNGESFRQSGIQTMSCGGSIYNLADTNNQLPGQAPVPSWMIAVLSVVAALAILFLILFAVYVSPEPPTRATKQENI